MADVIIIGAGPAGLIAAIEAAGNGHMVTLLEKNAKVGRKLYISGKGRCNITNNCDVNTLINNTPGNGNFLYSAFFKFNAQDIMQYFNELGVETKTERGNRVFPESDRASDVVDALYNKVIKSGVKLILNATVTKVDTGSKSVKYKCANSNISIKYDKLIIATGGASYPLTGSTGDGYRFAEAAGHTVTALKPSLIPFVTKEEWISQLQGLSLKNVNIKLTKNGTDKVFEDFGEMLFTHYGVSGPLILSASSHIRDFDYDGLELAIDLKPALTEEQLDERVKRDFSNNLNKNFANSLSALLPQSLIPVIVRLSGIEESKPVNQITKEERLTLVKTIKNFKITPIAPRPIEDAIITAGGINIKEINPKTMESKMVEDLYFAGEIIDVDAYTGGFNLTIAFSTGYTAGQLQ